MFYFSGTGNSKYIAELFSRNMNAECYSIEDDADFETLLNAEEVVAFCYPIFASRPPRIMREFVSRFINSLKDKKLVIFCTQMMFSGDGTRAFAALFPKGHARVIYTEHFFMPNNVTNFRILPDFLISDERIKRTIEKAERKMQKVCRDIKNNKIKKRGFNIVSRALGLLQAWVVPVLERKANKSVRIAENCTNCGLCVSICPMNNLAHENEKIIHKHNCTICYRCVNKCPEKAITAGFHGKVKKQYICISLLHMNPIKTSGKPT
jgi:ferredoxin